MKEKHVVLTIFVVIIAHVYGRLVVMSSNTLYHYLLRSNLFSFNALSLFVVK